MSRGSRFALIAGLLVLAAAWIGPLPRAAAHSFAAHMLMHMAVIAISAPLLAVAVAGSRFDPSVRFAFLFSALGASLLEFFVVWGWHVPGPHHFARHSTGGLMLEQGSFLVAGVILWTACLGPALKGRPDLAGIFGLLFTSMHMTLLGALLALAPRPLYAHGDHDVQFLGLTVTALQDQMIGGLIMLGLGGAIYLLGGLALVGRLLTRAAG